MFKARLQNILPILNDSEDLDLSSKCSYILTGLLFGEYDLPKRLFLEEYDGIRLIHNLLIINRNNFKNTKRLLNLIQELTRIEDKHSENAKTRLVCVEKIKEIKLDQMIYQYLSLPCFVSLPSKLALFQLKNFSPIFYPLHSEWSSY